MPGVSSDTVRVFEPTSRPVVTCMRGRSPASVSKVTFHVLEVLVSTVTFPIVSRFSSAFFIAAALAL